MWPTMVLFNSQLAILFDPVQFMVKYDLNWVL